MTLPTFKGKSGPIPNLSALGFSKFKKAQKALEKVDAVVAKSRENGRQHQAKLLELQELERGYDKALMEDALDEREPGQDPHKIALQLGEGQRELEGLERGGRAIRRAVDQATAQLAQLVQGDQEELLREVDARLVKAANEMALAALELQKREQAVSELEHLRLWATRPDSNLHAGPADVGRSQQIDAILAAAFAAEAKAAGELEGQVVAS